MLGWDFAGVGLRPAPGGAAAVDPELVPNGTFDADTDWTKSAGTVTISGGRLNFGTAGAVQDAYATLRETIGAGVSLTYSIEKVVGASGSANVSANLYNDTTLVQKIADIGGSVLETYSGTVVTSGTVNRILIRHNGVNSYAYDNVSLQRA